MCCICSIGPKNGVPKRKEFAEKRHSKLEIQGKIYESLLFLGTSADCSKKKSLFNSVLPGLLFFFFFFFVVAIKHFLSLHVLQLALLSLASWYFYISRIADRLGMTWVGASWTSVGLFWDLSWTAKISLLVSLYSDLMDEFEGSRRFDDHQWKL